MIYYKRGSVYLKSFIKSMLFDLDKQILFLFISEINFLSFAANIFKKLFLEETSTFFPFISKSNLLF